MPRLLNAANARGLPQLRRAAADTGLGIQEWRPVIDAEGRWMGKVVVQFSTEAEVRQLHSLLHGRSLNINGFEAELGVTSQHLDLETGAGQQRDSAL